MNLFEVWVQVEHDERSVPPHELVAKFHEGSRSIKADIFTPYKVPIRVFTGLLSTTFTKGICYSTSLVGTAVSLAPVMFLARLAFSGGSDSKVGSSLGNHATGDNEVVCGSRSSLSQFCH